MDKIIATVFGFSVIIAATSLGAALALFFKNDVSDRLNAAFSGLSAGIMIAASVWSLLLPAIERSAHLNSFAFLPATLGFLLGGAFLVIIDRLLPDNLGSEILSEKKRSAELFIAITVHNIPEGLAVGFAFGAANLGGGAQAVSAALGLAIGIAVQNFPEGAAVSLPLKRATGSKVKSFLFGVASGAVEPVAAVAGYFLAFMLTFIQPYLLAFSAGAMIYVVICDLIPSANAGGYKSGTWACMIGFAVMMALDVALG